VDRPGAAVEATPWGKRTLLFRVDNAFHDRQLGTKRYLRVMSMSINEIVD